MDRDDAPRILLPRATAERLAASMSRRRFLGRQRRRAPWPRGWRRAAATATTRSGDTSGATGAGAAPAQGPAAATSTASINLFTWAEYDDPDLMKSWGDINITIYNSNEEAIQKLAGVEGHERLRHGRADRARTSRRWRARGLLQPLDLSKIPNFANLDPQYTNQAWDPGNKYSVCKDWGTTGWIYDTTIVTTRHQHAGPTSSTSAQTEASGNLSVIDTRARPHRHLLLGQRHRLDDDRRRGRPRRLRGLPRQRARLAHQGLRLLPGHQPRPRATTPCRRCSTATPARA